MSRFMSIWAVLPCKKCPKTKCIFDAEDCKNCEHLERRKRQHVERNKQKVLYDYYHSLGTCITNKDHCKDCKDCADLKLHSSEWLKINEKEN